MSQIPNSDAQVSAAAHELSKMNFTNDEATKPQPKLWTNADYVRAEYIVQGHHQDMKREIEANFPDLPTADETDGYHRALCLMEAAAAHSTSAALLNITALASASWTASQYMQDGVLCHDGISDPEIDHAATKPSKHRLEEAIWREAEILGIKEFESVLWHLETLIDNMKDHFEHVRWYLKPEWTDAHRQYGRDHPRGNDGMKS